MPAAVFRRTARGRARRAREREIERTTNDDARDPGSEIETAMSRPNKVWPERIAWAEKNAINIAGTLRINVSPPKTPTLAQRTEAASERRRTLRGSSRSSIRP